uniref:Copia protein n=1 Tax=Cajanus cajan TaxID=3821 RepID=A0A151R9I2_CAJCA|nr:Copia protein [Cajanus cajan]
MASATPKSFIPQALSTPISSKLSEDNFLTWRQQADSTIRGYHLKKHILGAIHVPPQHESKFINLLSIYSWMAKKQRVVSRSSTEAEFKSLASLVAEIQFIQNLLLELHIRSKQSPLIWCNNQGVVLLSANPVMHTRTKHFELDLWFVRERVARGQIQARHILARFQVVDLLTKSPSSAIFLELRDKLTVDKQSTLSLKGDKRDIKSSICNNRYSMLAELE